VRSSAARPPSLAAAVWTGALAASSPLACAPETFELRVELVVPRGQDATDGLDWMSLDADYGGGERYTFVQEAPREGVWRIPELPPGDSVCLEFQGLVADPVQDGDAVVLASGTLGPVAIGPDAPELRCFFTRRQQWGRLVLALEQGRQDAPVLPMPGGGALVFGGTGEDGDALAGVERFALDGGPDSVRFAASGMQRGGRRDGTATWIPAISRALLLGTAPIFDARSGDALAPADAEEWDAAALVAAPELWSAETQTGSGFPLDDDVAAALVRAHHTATLLPGGRVLVAGGVLWDAAADYGLSLTKLSVLLDPADEEGDLGPQLQQFRWRHTATRLDDGRVLLVGGQGIPGSGELPDIVRAELFDAAEGGFVDGGAVEPGRGGHGAIKLPDGRVLVVGGFAERGTLALSDAWLFHPGVDPPTAAWSAAAPIAQARALPLLSVLPDGRVLACAGETEDGPVLGCEIYTPVPGGEGFWEDQPDPGGELDARHGPAMVELASGERLLLGGRGVAGGLPEDVLVWRP
jgi:hypothetical protein